MKIIYISEYFPYENEGEITGGVEARCLNIAKRLSKKNDITIITSWKTGQERRHKIGKINILRVGQHHKYTNEGNFTSRLKFSIAAYKTAKKLKADIIEGYNFISYLPAYYAGKKINAKKIATYHEVWQGEWIKNKGLIGVVGELWEKWTLSLKWDKIISVSKFTANKLMKNNIPKNKISVIYNGINLKDYTSKEKKYKNPTIISISRLTPKKRVDDLIKAIYLVKKQIPNIKLIIIGKGNELKNLQELVSKYRLQENVHFTGYVKDYADVIKMLKKSHIFCLPSILEGFGIVLTEAMAAKTPYICSDITVLKEVSQNQKGGLIFKQKNYKDLTNKILFLLKNKKLYAQKEKECEAIAKKYDWDKISKQVFEVYNK
ncbi:glycosyltransferase family 4 protein [Candidatus Woesearchaeota archaeon]|jgi:glycosyltransferase involved in cell wall biosynthesis|nr:glycosyltransferase family 4 protein [Candidatus Woesearchaeota archaeon]MBT7296716.1 glycosyltransferase family 4 protein [Candidatus Woesearchaeota archaeon]